MRHLLKSWLAAAVAAVGIAALASAQDKDKGKVEPPAAVKAAVEKAYPGAKITSCKEEKEEGKVEYEVKIETKEGKNLELVLSPEGKLLETEEKVALDKVPEAVMKAFAAKYPSAKATAAEKQTKFEEKGQKVFYDVAFEAGKEKKEATFAEDGTFIEEDDE